MENELFNSHVNLVYKIAHRMNYGYLDVEDLIQVGLMALYEASLKYDPSYNTKFSTYASIYIIGSIKKELRKNKPISLNKEIIRLIKQIKKLNDNLSVEELASKLHFKRKYNPCNKLSNDFVSLNNVTVTDELIELIPDSSYESINNEIFIVVTTTRSIK